jgi:hypothetical protein
MLLLERSGRNGPKEVILLTIYKAVSHPTAVNPLDAIAVFRPHHELAEPRSRTALVYLCYGTITLGMEGTESPEVTK